MDQLDNMYMKTTSRLQCAIFIVTCQPEASKMYMYAPPSRLIYPITHYTVRLTCDSSAAMNRNTCTLCI